MPVVTVIETMMTHMVPMAEVAVMPRIASMAEFTMVRRGVMKPVIAVTMIEALRLCRGHTEPQRGNESQCKQFFEYIKSA